MFKKLTFIILTFLSINLFAAISLPTEELVPGGIARVNLGIAANAQSTKPEAFFQEKKVIVYEHNGVYFALVGLPLSISTGKHQVKYKTFDGFVSYKDFEVKNKKYKVSNIKIKNKNMVNPDPKTQARIISDVKKIKSAINTFTNYIPNRLVLKQPVRGIPTTSFGARRVINGQKKNPHTGMDIAAATATPVYAAADGKVVLADNFYLSGNLVGIDHGSGFITTYAHLSEILVKVGDEVKVGDKIGRVGSTGRVTGPHLHWTVRVNETPVNPALFIEKIKHGKRKNDNKALGLGV